MNLLAVAGLTTTAQISLCIFSPCLAFNQFDCFVKCALKMCAYIAIKM